MPPLFCASDVPVAHKRAATAPPRQIIDRITFLGHPRRADDIRSLGHNNTPPAALSRPTISVGFNDRQTSDTKSANEEPWLVAWPLDCFSPHPGISSAFSFAWRA